MYSRTEFRKEPWLAASDGALHPLSGHDFLNVLHAYTDSQIPVILVTRTETEFHAVCVVGHTFKTATQSNYGAIWPERPEGPDKAAFRTTSQYLHTLLVHDDQLGPYVHLPISEVFPPEPGERNKIWSRCFRKHVVLMAVPIPDGVHVPAEDALFAVGHVLKRLSTEEFYAGLQITLDDEARGALGVFAAWLAADECVVNVYLDLGKRVVENLSAAYSESDGEFVEKAICADWPAFCWVAEICRAGPITGHGDKVVVGHVFLDATTPWADEYTLVALKLPGLCAVRSTGRGWQYMAASGALATRFIVRNYARSGWIKDNPGVQA